LDDATCLPHRRAHLFLVLPAAALADVGYRGNSGDGGLVTLRTSGDRVPKRFHIAWVLRGDKLLDRCYLRTRWGVLRQG
jgi:hypothetical protein